MTFPDRHQARLALSVTRLLGMLVAACFFAACANAHAKPDAPTEVLPAIELSGDLRLRQIADGLWLHVSEKDMPPFGRVPSNGLVVFGNGGALLVDTPWTPAQTVMLIDWIERVEGSRLEHVIVTHAHEDRTGGVAAIPPRVRIHALDTTVELAAALGRVFGAEALPEATSLQLVGKRVETFFPGAGHTPDNLVVWLPEERVLFGGCFIKSAGAVDLGNVADADPASWRDAVRRVQQRHPDAVVVVPGHGAVGGQELLAHTAALLDAVPAPAAAH